MNIFNQEDPTQQGLLIHNNLNNLLLAQNECDHRVMSHGHLQL